MTQCLIETNGKATVANYFSFKRERERKGRIKGLASYCKAETTFTFHFSILTL